MENGFNNWKEQHVKQGFSWRPGSVCFGLLRDVGNVFTTVTKTEVMNIKDESEIAILVPFFVSQNQQVDLSDTVYFETIKLSSGNYSLLFEVGMIDNEDEFCRLSFISPGSDTAEILRSNSSLSPTFPLLMSADPA